MPFASWGIFYNILSLHDPPSGALGTSSYDNRLSGTSSYDNRLSSWALVEPYKGARSLPGEEVQEPSSGGGAPTLPSQPSAGHTQSPQVSMSWGLRCLLAKVLRVVGLHLQVRAFGHLLLHIGPGPSAKALFPTLVVPFSSASGTIPAITEDLWELH